MLRDQRAFKLRGLVKRALLLTLAALAASCGPTVASPQSEELGESAAPIVGGTINPGDPAVVSLTAFGSPYCTGTLIGPSTILTAAHCIYAAGEGARYSARFGTYSREEEFRVRIISQYAHPNYTDQSLSSDIGVLRLETPVSGIRPIPMNDFPLSQDDVGKDIRHVGFGVTTKAGGGSGSGTKREATYPVREISQTLIESGGNGIQQTCSGDSGGPGLMRVGNDTGERIAGVVSFGDENCEFYGADTRVDVFLPWVKSVYEQWDPPQCGLDARCLPSCDPVDPDCLCGGDGACAAECPNPAWDPDCPRFCGADKVCSPESCLLPDPDCVPAGEACVDGTDCEGALCVEREAGNYCSRPCDNGQCPEGMVCGGQDLCYLSTDFKTLERATAVYPANGCSSGGAPFSLLGLLAVALGFTRRRSTGVR